MSSTGILEGLNQALAHTRGDDGGVVSSREVRVPDAIDVKAVREKLGMSQPMFAVKFGIPLATLRNWEQGRRRPEAMARVLLKIIDDNPSIVERTLATG